MAVQFFGQYLLAKGVITANQLLKVIEYQELQNLRIGEFAIRQGLLAESDASRVNQLQLSQDIRFGEAAVQLGVLEELDVQILLAAQRNSHIYFGEAAVLLRFASREEVNAALETFNQEQAAFAREVIAVPESVLVADLASDFFDLGIKMVRRYWGVGAKAGEVVVDGTELSLEGNAAQVTISGEVEARCMLAVPDGAADEGGKQILKVSSLGPADRIDLTKELANLICGNLVARLGQSGKTITIAPPEELSSAVDLAGQRLVRLDGVTPHGPLTMAVAY